MPNRAGETSLWRLGGVKKSDFSSKSYGGKLWPIREEAERRYQGKKEDTAASPIV